jgi:pimeloyl-ACP methyl ester carboxylesterase
MRDTSMTLPDGRALAYTELGTSDGPLVMYFHGTPSTRLDLVAYDEDLAGFGVWVVSADRPGYGRSSPQPGRRLSDWPVDVAALADHVGVEPFAVMGISAGAPYVAACAALLPERVVAAAIVAGVTDFGWPGAWDGYPEGDAAVMRLGDETAATTWCEERFGADGSRFFKAVAEDPLAPADEAFIANETFRGWLAAWVREAFRQGVGGYAQDATVQGRPWAFDPKDIAAPMLVVHGDADTMVPVAHAHHTAEVMPNVTLRILPDQGHLSLIPELPPISAELATLLP